MEVMRTLRFSVKVDTAVTKFQLSPKQVEISYIYNLRLGQPVAK